ncbi:LppU/SCO3897 family protein [Amycolatopsis sp. CA-230715]|uniref:LppU/SCO3897 family protein n=1 Tax=Amycolatopsis sp. CA-230715 TaxID=2745196 RepID=UPI001C0300DF|nr:hypothetical protein [Amycolatopsis sp. CA-230715]QWF83115.1 hypothetical protein HUW46_06555 [Amycolatopsis sp. CA-230715]
MRVAAVVLTCLVAVLGLAGCSGKNVAFATGDCLRGPLGSSQQDLVKVACGAGDALYKVESVAKPNRCPRDYDGRDISDGTSARKSTRMCLFMDLKPGTCIRLWDPAKSASDPVVVPCGPDALRVGQRLDGVSDQRKCPAGTSLTKTYPRNPVFTLCMEKPH